MTASDPNPRVQARHGVHDINYVMAVSCDARFSTPTGPRRADELAASAPKTGWQRLSCGDGSKGRRLYDWLLLDPGSHVSGQHLLLVRRSISQPSELAYYICHFSRPVPVAELVHLAGSRWGVEETFQFAKNETGLDHYQVRRRPGGPPVMVGGSGGRTLALVARYADIWNGLSVTPAQYRERSDRLDGLITAAGRRPEQVRRTMTFPVLCQRDRAELERRLAWTRRTTPMFAGMSTETLAEALRQTINMFVGTPEELVTRIAEFTAASADEVMLQWFGLDDIEGSRCSPSTSCQPRANSEGTLVVVCHSRRYGGAPRRIPPPRSGFRAPRGAGVPQVVGRCGGGAVAQIRRAREW